MSHDVERGEGSGTEGWREGDTQRRPADVESGMSHGKRGGRMKGRHAARNSEGGERETVSRSFPS